MSEYKLRNIKVGIINLNINNIYSIYSSFNSLGFKTKIMSSNDKTKYNLVILPGVGSYRYAMKKIKENGYDEIIMRHIENKENFLYGICLGMQLLLDKSSEFGETKGLGLIEGSVKKLSGSNIYNVPNIGWHKIYSSKESFIKKDQIKKYFYFIHSFYCDLKNPKYQNTYFKFNKKKICSSLRKNNIIGTQFHPEKSGKEGHKLVYKLKRFFA
ncbi:imidazole glycerol phosphate synthase subunit HisH [Pelagibacterales bacterium SAG-MED23]|nr:imidazole glycerol phosphate synthase subunit HisH [Pelagibacterales bacterium SAG-MED23]|tara:strand:- start:115 stop:753 length:639 start_codon:yes stop_codon:yes gene_type:complete